MKRALLLALSCTALLVAACAPSLTGGTIPPMPKVLDPSGATLRVASAVDASGRAYSVVQFGAGKADVTRGTLNLTGLSLAVNTPTCTPDGDRLRCVLPPLKAGVTYSLPVRGLTSVSAVYYRADSAGAYALNVTP